MKGYVVVVRFDIFESNFIQFLELIRVNAKESIKEEGCLQFDISTNENTVFLYEIYNSKEDFILHTETEHYKYFKENTSNYVSNKLVETYNLDFHNLI